MSSKIQRVRDAFNAYKQTHGSNWQASGGNAAGGAIAGVVYGVLSDRVATLRSAWYYEPIVLFLAGHYLKKRYPALGNGMIGAAGYAFARNSQIDRAVRATVAQGFGTRAAGAGDAGALSTDQIQQRLIDRVADNVARRQLGARSYDAGAYIPHEAGAYVSNYAEPSDIGLL